MSEFSDKAKDAMGAAREKAGDAMDNAMDIARDQLDTFKKLSQTGRIVVLSILGVLSLALFLWIFWPHTPNITVEMVPEPIIGNSVAISNYEEEDLGPTTVILDGQYEATLEGLPSLKTTSISVLEFHTNGDPNGAVPDKLMMPLKIVIKSSLGTKTRKFKR